MSLEAYTDGAAEPNPGKGGWGVVIVENGTNIFELAGRQEFTTNNRMEITAAIEAIRWAVKSKVVRLTIYSDSKYLVNGASSWMHSWKQKGWIRKKKGKIESVKNRELWEEIDRLKQQVRVRWEWIRGHNGNRWNERADTIATNYAMTEYQQPKAQFIDLDMLPF